MTEQKEWSWRDSGQHKLPVRLLNMASRLSGYARKRFDPDTFIDQAIRETGLDDFGDPGFREGLDLICRTFSEDEGMTGLGQMAARGELVKHLSKRLQVVDWCKQHPDIHNQVIDKPWMITGLPRSGTTLASVLVDADPVVRSPLVWEVDNPVPPTTLASRYVDPRIAQSEKELQKSFDLSPPMRAMHALDAGHPQECIAMTWLDFQSILVTGLSQSREYYDWYAEVDRKASYRMHKQLLQIWQAAFPTAHWGLKAPNHMHAMADFMYTYPDARVIWSHRDPLVAIPSVVSLHLGFLRTFNCKVDPVKAAQEINDFWLRGIEKMIAYDKNQLTGWCHHLHYRDLMTDPVAAMRGAYNHFGEDTSTLHERRMTAWVEQRPKNTYGRHVYSLDDFGLDPGKLREQYGEYIETYKVADEYTVS